MVALGNPFAGRPKASNAWKQYERMSCRPTLMIGPT